ncbi:MAG TPA: 3-oxoacyl-ACP reductase FabG [Gammaproteobacteria bacterium]|jgi:3-oxoacyl-[acyl-carrier protein] reductase|nr:3-oxoacyl-ACP reductase FabG [Gammaproteobacteria bacterium]HIF88004.1 3-oxoacyl-ACP reductase FabG [Gammaproteobacteria bacterium]HIL64245.1 3-oxoacyl-ACP reductase FabG [Porticoccaceae bacterium]HIN91085.1 3-oxoacyl-ACP reductase FabG [Porticoccaceae bacterium]
MSELEVIALVTGASRGIGRAIAIELAGNKAYTVIGTATTAQGADSIGTYLAEVKAKGEGLVVDVASDDSVTGLINTIKEKYGAPAVLVNNAGITRDNLLMRMQSEEWSAVIDTNLGSMYRVCKACVRGMTKARWGRIINISSVVASSGNAGQTNYAASKAGIEGFTRALAMEIGSRGITVNAVAPGFIDTDMTRGLGEKQAQYMLAQIPLARFGQPQEIASLIGFLVTENAAYITGETIHVNGGMYMG